MRHLAAAIFCAVLFCSITWGQEKIYPLQPPDRSSPRATLNLFLQATDKLADLIAREYRYAPSEASYARVLALAQTPIDCLDLSEIPQAGRFKSGAAAATALYETLSRIDLPPLDQVPSKDDLKSLTGDPPHWVIPNTPIEIVRISRGPRTGDFVFSAHTVANAEEYYTRTMDLPYTRPVPQQIDIYKAAVMGGGWLIPFTTVERFPPWLLVPLLGESIWKWIALGIVILAALALLWPAYRLSQRGGDDHPFLQAIARLALPLYVLAAMPIVTYLALVQINLRGHAGATAQLVSTAAIYLTGAWLSWRITDVIAEAVISSPRVKRQSIDAHLTRICARLLGIGAAVALLVTGADKVGVPVYGVIAGLGVGGLAIALSAQPTIENLIGGLNLFADRPIRVGHLCKYGTDIGTVEEIGIRSTRIRGADRAITTIPNGVLSKMSIVNMTQRERMLIQTSVSLGDAGRARVRYCLEEIQRILREHANIHHATARARLTRFTGTASEIEVFAYAETRDHEQFLNIQEDVLLHVMEILEESKSASVVANSSAATSKSKGNNSVQVMT